MISAVLFVSFFIFLIMGIPIGICLGLSSVCATYSEPDFCLSEAWKYNKECHL